MIVHRAGQARKLVNSSRLHRFGRRWLSGGGKLSLVILMLALVAAMLAIPAAASRAPHNHTELAGKVPDRTDPGALPPIGGRAGSDSNPEVQDRLVPGQYIVVLTDSVDHPGAVAKTQTEHNRGRLGFVYRHALVGYSAKLSDAAVEALRKSPNVKYVSPVRRYEAMAQTVPAGIKRLGATNNPALDIDGIDDVRVDADVAIIDTGIDFTHPDLNVVGRTNCVPPSESESEWSVEQCIDNAGVDGDGHGTHVAGTVGAIDNGIGVVGVAPGARLWAVRVLGNDGSGYDPWIIAGIDWVAGHSSQIEVANMSLGGSGRSQPTEEAINGAVNAGVVVVVAAGNAGVNALQQSPANVPAAITVSAMVDTDGLPGGKGPSCNGKDDTLVNDTNWGSNWGSAVDLAAPGACVYSTLPVAGLHYGASSYGSLSGTSMAAPHVAGAAATLAAKSNPGTKADVEAIRKQLVAGGGLNWTDVSEDGAYEPLAYVGGTPLASPEAATGGWRSTEIAGATLTGSLNTRGLEASYRFEYGLTTGYGQTASTSTQSADGSYMSVKANIVGLEPGRTYHYRLSLTTPQGTVYGADRTFVPSQWASQTLLNGPASEDEQLFGVSCPTDGWCMGVDWRHITGGTQQLGSYKLTGAGQWTFVSMPTPFGGSFPLIKDVSCTSTSNCIAVGRVQLGTKVVPLAEKWNGTSWSIQSAPAPPTETSEPYARLDDVSCASSTECMAVGYFKVSESGGEPLWRVHVSRMQAGGTWTNMYPLPAGPGDLLGVSCPSTSFCAVVGYGESLTWNGFSWSAHPQAVDARFEEVSCTSPSFCLAVGTSPYAQVWDGTKWSQIERQPADLYGSDLYGVDCASPEYCIAAGFGYGALGIHPVVERWDGSTLVAQATVRESERFASFWGVDCSPTSGCAAVGGVEGETKKPLIVMAPEWRPGLAFETPQVGPDEANLRGSVDPNGFATNYRFEWGPTSAYGNVAPIPDKAVGEGSSPVKVNLPLAGLKPGTTYHYRLVAESEEGKSVSPDMTFKTLDWAPTFSKSVGTFGSGEGQFNEAFSVAVSPVNGAVAVADPLNNRIQIFDEEGKYVRQFGTKGSANGQFKEPYGVAFDKQGDVWVADTYNNRVQELTATGQFIRAFGAEGTANGAFKNPFAIVVDGSETVWVADTYNKRVQAFSATGTYLSKFSTGEYNFGIAVDSGGDIWSSTSSAIRENSSAGALLRSFGSSGSSNGQLWNARGIAVDGHGNVWVTDSFNDRVQVFSATGEYLTKFGASGSGNGQFSYPGAVALDPRGNVWITDKGNSRLQRWTSWP